MRRSVGEFQGCTLTCHSGCVRGATLYLTLAQCFIGNTLVLLTLILTLQNKDMDRRCWRIWLWLYSIFVLFSANVIKRPKPIRNWSNWALSVYPKPNISYSSVPHSSIVVQTLLKTHQWATSLHWVTCSSITMNTHIDVYFESIPHECHKYPLGVLIHSWK